MNVASLRADCARCAALCCVAFRFERSAQFAIDKAAGVPCPRLDACGACTIHARRAEEGFGGCAPYDCLGAGQRVVQATFGGARWLDDPALLTPMLRAFEVMRRLHELLALLATARQAALPDPCATEADRYEAMLQAIAEAAGCPEARRAADQADLEVRAFLRSLQPWFRRRPDPLDADL